MTHHIGFGKIWVGKDDIDFNLALVLEYIDEEQKIYVLNGKW